IHFSVVKIERAKVGLAEAHGVSEQGLEHGLQLAGRTRNDAQHLGRRRLLLPRFGKLARARLELLFQLGSGLAHPATARSRLRSGRTKLAAARWAICAFERQGHLVGTVTGPPSGRPRAYQS